MCGVLNKEQIASRIWKIANDLRGSIEANDYKDYILGFIFYKYLSDNEQNFLEMEGFELELLNQPEEEISAEIEYIKENIGYFIAPKNLYNHWVELGNRFTVDDVITALSAFNRHISPRKTHQKVFGGILNSLEAGIGKLGTSVSQRTKQVRSLVNLIKDIPTQNDDYDVLGYIYEYLIGKFAAGAGASSGEFFTPSGPMKVMSYISAHHLKDRDKITVYDPTSGSGSLLLNIGKEFAKFTDTHDAVKYYAQEYMGTTERLTRMNLIMRGVSPDNIVSRNGDSLGKQDYPYYDDAVYDSYTTEYADAVVSNPPYSQKWDPENKESDPRFSGYGMAPKSKADYAFLLHGLYHLNPDGIMSIVLPHGVLFRGGEEGKIRRKLLEKGNIEAVVGLPADIFYGTGIPTVILFLKKTRVNKDVLFVDASKGFIKEGKKNNLRPMDIKRIVDTVINRLESEHYSRVVSLEEIIDNDYNLNIPRYINSSDETETYDLYASLHGGIPVKELNTLKDVFDAISGLYDELFHEVSEGYVEVNGDLNALFAESHAVNLFKERYYDAFDGYGDLLTNTLIEDMNTFHPLHTKNKIVDALFTCFESVSLVDKYEGYDILEKEWVMIQSDMEIIQQAGLEKAGQAVDSLKEIVKGVEKHVGYSGRLFDFGLVQETFLRDDLAGLNQLKNKQSEIEGALSDLIESLDKEETDVLNARGDKFVQKALKDTLSDLDDEDPLKDTLTEAVTLLAEEKVLKTKVNDTKKVLEMRTMERIEGLTLTEIKDLLALKWLRGIKEGLDGLADKEIKELQTTLKQVSEKYTMTLSDLNTEIEEVSSELVDMLVNLKGNSSDMAGVASLIDLLKGV